MRDRDSNAREVGGWERKRDERRVDIHEVFLRDLELPRGQERERVEDFKLRESQARILAIVGAFRAVPQEDLERAASNGRTLSEDVRRLREAGLVATQRYVAGRDRCTLVTLTDRGHSLLEDSRREGRESHRQIYYAGPSKQRELAHDSRLFRAYADAARQIGGQGGRISRVRLDTELKRDYQRFLQEPNRGRRDASGRPRRDLDAIADWARQHDLPVVDDSVRFPDLRIEYDRPDGQRCHEDIEVITPHYRGAHLSGKAASGFSCYRYQSARIGGARGASHGGRARDSRLAEEMLR